MKTGDQKRYTRSLWHRFCCSSQKRPSSKSRHSWRRSPSHPSPPSLPTPLSPPSLYPPPLPSSHAFSAPYKLTNHTLPRRCRQHGSFVPTRFVHYRTQTNTHTHTQCQSTAPVCRARCASAADPYASATVAETLAPRAHPSATRPHRPWPLDNRPRLCRSHGPGCLPPANDAGGLGAVRPGHGGPSARPLQAL